MIVLGLSVSASGCGRSHATGEAPAHEPLTERLARSALAASRSVVSSEKHLGDVKRVPANSFDGVAAFDVAARGESLRRFPCRECHTEPLARLVAQRRGERKAHWEIELRHASTATMTCAICHAGGPMESLRTLNGQAVDFDHGYQVCAQCHVGQVRDWAGGAHGKRLGGWAPPRVVVSCAACHDPHQPRLPKRWPSRSSRLLTTRE